MNDSEDITGQKSQSLFPDAIVMRYGSLEFCSHTIECLLDKLVVGTDMAIRCGVIIGDINVFRCFCCLNYCYLFFFVFYLLFLGRGLLGGCASGATVSVEESLSCAFKVVTFPLCDDRCAFVDFSYALFFANLADDGSKKGRGSIGSHTSG